MSDTHAVPVSETGRIPDDDDAAGEGDTGSLSPREAMLADELAAGSTLAQAAKAASISERSARRWKAKPAIADAIRVRLSENTAVGRAVLSSGMARAARALVAMAAGTEEADAARVSACRAVTDGAVKLLEIDGMVARLAQLETRLEVSRTENLTPAEMAARFMRATRIAQEILAEEAAGPRPIDAIEVGAPPVAPAVPPAGLATIETVAAPAPAPVLSSVPMGSHRD